MAPPTAAARRAAGAPSRRPRARAASSPAAPTDNVSRAYRELRHIIVWGQLPPGSRISERIIAERLGLSRTPVRSALHRLEQEGFVASYGQGRERRLIVAPLTMPDGQEVFSITGHLEGLAARTAAFLPKARRDAIVRRLREVNGELAARSRKNSDATSFFELDIEFHSSYVEGVVGPRLLTLHHAIKPQSERYSRLYVSVFLDQISTSVREHERIAAAIARGDADAAQHAAETNWHNAADRLARVIEQHGERGSWQGAGRLKIGESGKR
ncbi:MAG TPA: GntR family transcriptional regulator [Gemmatimonadaceae bacterium]